MGEITLGIWDSARYQTVKIENVDFEGKVEVLKTEACKKLNSQETALDLVYCGLILENDHTLTFYGIHQGVTVQVVKRVHIEAAPPGRTLAEAQALVAAFRTFTSTSGYRAALLRLSRPEILETIIAATPGLAQDPAAIAIIQDPELIVHMADPETVRKVAEKHPSLIDAANYIAAHIHEEHSNLDTNQASTSTGYSYSLEALSDDEDMEPPSREAHPLARNTSFNAITAAQLAAAIASATDTAFNTNSAGVPSTPASGASSSTGNNIITNEMFSSAMQQAFASTPFAGNANSSFGLSPSQSRSEIESLESTTRRLQPQLQQMHEMGLMNDSLNIRALQATAGNVEAAIELVFNGTVD